MNQNNHAPDIMNPNSNSIGPRNWKTKQEIAAYYKCHLRTITNLMRRGVLPYRKIGRFVRLDPVECDRALEKFKHRGFLGDEDNL